MRGSRGPGHALARRFPDTGKVSASRTGMKYYRQFAQAPFVRGVVNRGTAALASLRGNNGC